MTVSCHEISKEFPDCIFILGGYGDSGLPYDHIDNPYKDDPFRNQVFNDPKPKIYREYGAPLFGRN
jgi:hypothetical protein